MIIQYINRWKLIESLHVSPQPMASSGELLSGTVQMITKESKIENDFLEKDKRYNKYKIYNCTLLNFIFLVWKKIKRQQKLRSNGLPVYSKNTF